MKKTCLSLGTVAMLLIVGLHSIPARAQQRPSASDLRYMAGFTMTCRGLFESTPALGKPELDDIRAAHLKILVLVSDGLARDAPLSSAERQKYLEDGRAIAMSRDLKKIEQSFDSCMAFVQKLADGSK
jgi:hypothetical protein